MKQTESLKAFYRAKAREHEIEAAFCFGKDWQALGRVQLKLADEWLAKIAA